MTELTPTNSSILSNLSFCELYQPSNPYCGRFSEGAVGEYIDLLFLLLFSVVGTFGNILVVFSLVYENRVHKNGNIFVINLAAADLFICGIGIPLTIPNIIYGRRFIPLDLCYVIGLLSITCCACSVCNLSFIALNRYWSVVHPHSSNIFKKRNTILMTLFAWVWSFFISSPVLYGWSRLTYDYTQTICVYDDTFSLSYNIFFMVVGINLPVCIILYSYGKLYWTVKKTRSNLMLQLTSRNNSRNLQLLKTRVKQNIALLKTLAVTVFAFLVSWLPYGIIILFFAKTVPPDVKRIAVRLGLSNSMMNFIIYGVMNSTYRKGYKNSLKKIFCSKMWNNSDHSTSSNISNSGKTLRTLISGFRKRLRNGLNGSQSGKSVNSSKTEIASKRSKSDIKAQKRTNNDKVIENSQDTAL